MNRIPKVSVIIPVYKAEQYLSKCIDSVIRQSFSDWELILVDDGSPDNSGEMCDKYSARDERIKTIHKSNGGVSSARQTGLDAATGEYIIHVDPDDWIEHNMLEDMLAFAIEEGSDMIICDYFEDRIDGSRVISQKPTSISADDVFRDMFSSKLIGSCWNKLIKRSIFKQHQVSFPNDYTLLEDIYVHSNLCLHNIKIAYLPKAYYHYILYNNPDSLTRKPNKDGLNSLISFCSYFEPMLEQRGLIEECNSCKYYAKEFALDSGAYSKRQIRGIFPEVNSYARSIAFKYWYSRPWYMSNLIKMYFPSHIGKMYLRLINMEKRIFTKRI